MTNSFVDLVVASREAHPFAHHLRDRAEVIARQSLQLLFPHFGAAPACEREVVQREMNHLTRLLQETIASVSNGSHDAPAATHFMQELATVRTALVEDAEALAAGDPAAQGVDEVILAYPGFLSTAVHRLAHVLYRLQIPLLPRLMSEWAHSETGIDIHPGARIGHAFAIDHGTGVVIGETTTIGDRVRIYQGVTLGALAVHKRMADRKRHPTIEDDVVIYANATILGGDTVVGAGSIIGGNVWLTHSVPPRSRVQFESTVDARPPDDGIEFHI